LVFPVLGIPATIAVGSVNSHWPRAGDVYRPFDAERLGGPVEGPGLRGDFGLGTWVESRFDLSPFRGQRVRLRFLTSTLDWCSTTSYESWEGPYNDGWWIDDVTITNVLLEPATVSPDDKDNSALAADTDGDCVADVNSDCAPGNPEVWGLPGAVPELYLTHVGGTAGTTTVGWGPPATRGGRLDVDYVVTTKTENTCDETVIVGSSTTTHSDIPGPGQLYRFLVQAQNSCGRGPLGIDSNRIERGGCVTGASTRRLVD
jgi:hypothetical protein